MNARMQVWRWALAGALGAAVGLVDLGAPEGAEVVAAPGGLRGDAPVREGTRGGDTLRIVEEETVLAVVVQTTGLAARFAPDHLIHASEYDLLLVLDPAAPESAVFGGSISVADLVVDDVTLQREVEARLMELGILEDAYDEVSDGDRESVRASMLAEDQLDADRHASIEAELVSISPSGDEAFPWTLTGALTVRGTRVEVPLRARLELEHDGEGARVRIEAFGALRFTDLGIEPYSAFLGAVRNRDEFHLYLDLVARGPDS
jgi:polyisoprenoid-binding protein YceI